MQSSASILIVDDHDGFRTFARGMLEAAGFTVTEAATGAEATKAARAVRPGLVLLDIQLPDQSGIELLQLVREKYDQVLVFIMTNHASEQYRAICRQMGANRFFDKSMDFARISEALAIAC